MRLSSLVEPGTITRGCVARHRCDATLRAVVEAPLPPVRLMTRVGRSPEDTDAAAFYLARARAQRARIDAALPADWSWGGRRALDFGCGAGRTLRQFLPEAESAEFVGCDIDGEAIAWLNEHLSPPLRGVEVTDRPAFPFPDRHFDVIWGMSVFTHIYRDWARWLLELRRVLRDDGYLLLTFLHEGRTELWREVTGGEPWDPDRLGMAVFRQDAPWEHGGPIVFHSEWWLRAHWGRAFDIEHLDTIEKELRQGMVVLRKRPGEPAPEDLERPEPGEPREAAAALWERDRLRRELDAVYASRSWRISRPLRAVAGRIGRR
jgi:SAM-dependent methyltransferase